MLRGPFPLCFSVAKPCVAHRPRAGAGATTVCAVRRLLMDEVFPLLMNC